METDRTRNHLSEGSPSRARTFDAAAEAPRRWKWWFVPLWLAVMAGAAWLTVTVLQHREVLQAQIPAAKQAIVALGDRMS